MAQIPIDVNSSGATHELIPAKAGHKIKVWQYTYSVSQDCTIVWKRGSTPLTGTMSVYAAGGFVTANAPPSSPGEREPLFETDVGEALNMTVSTTSVVGGHMQYAYKKV